MVNFLWGNIFRHSRKDRHLQAILKECPLFEHLSAGELRFLAEIVHVRSYQPGEVVFFEGEIGVGMYIICHGEIEVYARYNDEEELVATLSAGDFLGESSLVEVESRRTATARAKQELKTIGFFKTDLKEITARSPLLGVKILTALGQVLALRLRATSEKIIELKQEVNRFKESRPTP